MGWTGGVIVTVDTNVLVRVSTHDDAQQALVAANALTGASAIVVPLPVLCEYVWVLRRAYDLSNRDIAQALRTLLAIDIVKVDRPAADAGLAVLEAGGDFADGVIAHEGREQNAEFFVTFDRRAASILTQQGVATRLLT